MIKFISINLLLFICSSFVIAQDYSKDLTQKPTEFNNQLITITPDDKPNGTLSESFEDPAFPPAGWSLLNPDGGSGWTRLTAGTTPFPGWQGGTVLTPPGGDTAVAYATWTTGGATYNDQWIVTPQITNVQTGDELSFWMWLPFSSYADSVDLLISTTGTDPADFNIIVEQFYLAVGSTDTSWTQYTYTLSDYVSAGSDIYIAWREHVSDNFNDGAIVCLDLVEVTTTSSVELSSTTVPDHFSIEQNYPNPFNPSTQISFSLSVESEVTLTIFNALGEKMLDLVNNYFGAGSYTAEFDASGLTSGIYFYKIDAAGIDGTNFSETKKMVLKK